MHAILFSNSKNPDDAYLAHTHLTLKKTLKRGARVAFVPFAGTSIGWDEYLQRVRVALQPLKLEIESVADAKKPSALLADADAVMVGGGNTFRLLAEMRARKLLSPIARAVNTCGAVFIGWSAGSNLASPTICTTNDMPIVDPKGFKALGLIPFQINPHYNNALPPGHQGETRNQRIAEFLALNPRRTVIGLPEGDWLQVRDERISLHGPYDAVLFNAKSAPQVLKVGRLKIE